jgi:hypothetical protein
MGRFLRCDCGCGAEVDACHALDGPDPWPAVLVGNEDMESPYFRAYFRTYGCLAEWAMAKAMDTEVETT